MPFRNIQIDPNDLPQIGELQYVPLHTNYRSVSMIGTFLFWVFIASAIMAFFGTVDEHIMDFVASDDHNLIWVIGSILGILFLFSMLVAFIGFSKKGYALRERDIVYTSGLFWKSIITIPFNRVQHAEVKQGPIERMFSISQLNIFTAGGSASDLRIPGLTLAEAESLKRFVVNKVSKDEEE